MDLYAQIVTKIIEAQEAIIGPVALEQAGYVENLRIDWSKHQVNIEGDGVKVVDDLVSQYESLFGKTSVEVCKDVASHFLSDLPVAKQPQSLV